MALNRLADGTKLLHHSIYTEYRKYDKIPKTKKVKGREELRKVMDCICKHIGEGVVENPGGVVVDGLGYFFVWMPPRKGTYFQKGKEGSTEEYNYHTDHYMYFPTFIPMKPRVKVLNAWTMDKTFHEQVRLGVRDKLKGGAKFRMYAHTLKQL